MGKTKIEWVRGQDGSDGMSWNALRAEARIIRNEKEVTVSANHCEHVNEACRFCYSERGNARLGGFTFKPGHRHLYRFTVNEKTLLGPVRRRKPTKIFVESTSDAFGEWWPREFVDQLYAVMALTPQHVYINLSKRPQRRLEYLADPDMPARVAKVARSINQRMGNVAGELTLRDVTLAEPLPNVIEGTSVSCQEEADEFAPILLATRAACRVVSAEPLLGPIDFTALRNSAGLGEGHRWLDALGSRGHGFVYEGGDTCSVPRLDWVIIGGESGRQDQPVRPLHPDWARSIRDQCGAADVPFFFKQWGEYLPGEVYSRMDGETQRGGFVRHQDGTENAHQGLPDHWWTGDTFGGLVSTKVGKKLAGRLLDGQEHNGFPVL